MSKVENSNLNGIFSIVSISTVNTVFIVFSNYQHMAKQTIDVQGHAIRLLQEDSLHYICITDIVKSDPKVSTPNDVIKNYLRNNNNVKFLAVWEAVHNDDFNANGYNRIKRDIGDSNYTLSVSEWIRETNAVGLKSFAGRYGGTYAHEEIAIQFTTWFNPEFYVYFIKEFKRMAEEERRSLLWYLDKITTNALENATLAQSVIEQRNLQALRKKWGKR